MFRSTAFDKCLDKATSNLLMEADWPSILQICDLVRQNDVQPKYVFTSLRKKLFSPNPHTAYYALQVLESLVKNCGAPIHDELTTKANCDMLLELTKKTQHENVRQKLLELIQVWNFAFRKNPKHNSLKELMNSLKADGYKFPTLRESDAMFMSDSAPAWADGDVCHRCRVAFSMVQRKHHCRACGQVFCGQCSQKTISLPKFGIEKEVRVCDSCFAQETRPATSKTNSGKQEDSQLPAEYLASSLAQQSQMPPRKTEDELREEEELNLAIALSQSEAEAKEKEKMKVTAELFTPNKVVSEARPKERSPSPPSEEQTNPELARYLDRTYWENRQTTEQNDTKRATSPSAPATAPVQNNVSKPQTNGISDSELNDFIETLKSQVEIFINRMKSNSSRGRSIACDSSVQTLFMNITAMHSQLLRYIQQHDDQRLYYERLQDKLTQVKDARAALDALREEHREKLRKQAEEAERQRQQQMAHKLEIMRKKKQEYLQYQRQLALQRIQEQEREMQMRQEQQKQQYLVGSQFGTFSGSPAHNQPFPPPQPSNSVPYNYSYPQMSLPPNMPGPASGGPGPQPMWNNANMRMASMPPGFGPGAIPQGVLQKNQSQGLPPPGQNTPLPNQVLSQSAQSLPQIPQGLPQSGPPGMPQPGPPGLPQHGPGLPQPGQNLPPHPGQGLPHAGPSIPPPEQRGHPQSLPQHLQNLSLTQGQYQPQGGQGSNHNEDAQTAELISFD
ncbi:hepatocyte growth factor-regulated tyrosine kinase substrate [Agrilus planipennis]|uniref:Hepatocyte growth factor-regulated tyrosine kinase substrate n=1 Tax=Agrilus planipennis TaxID=224129 RepID=A0A1W4WJ79_AGRPL|nr:hepatocyte growth factor-regulated tyrosine kinase substrate [Agrilus planipennis]